MADYNYSWEIKGILDDLKSVNKTLRYEKQYKDALKPEHEKVLRKAYLTALKVDLYSLYTSLDIWVASDLPMLKE